MLENMHTMGCTLEEWVYQDRKGVKLIGELSELLE